MSLVEFKSKYDIKKCLKIISNIFDTSNIQYCNKKICSLWGFEKNTFVPQFLTNYVQVY